MSQKISILVAARNEEAVIRRCLEALARLTYPAEHLQILLGNDDSTDRTQDIIAEFIADKPHFELLNIAERVGEQRGKGNVLAQLARRAVGEIWLITDADIAVPPDWVQAVLPAFENPRVGIVGNFTWIEARDIFSACQALEWGFIQSILSFFSSIGVGITMQGNNMAFRRAAYEEIGGYEALPFSVTEDFQLFWAIKAHGYESRNIASHEGLVTSLPAPDWHSVLRQRRRWLVGAFKLGWGWKIIAFLRTFFLLFLFIMWFSFPNIAKLTLFASCGLTATVCFQVLSRTKKTHYAIYIPFFCIYQEFVFLGSVFYLFKERNVFWKERIFESKL